MKKWKTWKKEYGAKAAFEDYYQPIKENVIEVLNWYKQQNKKVVIWGGGVKGTAFLQIVDPKAEYISFVIDIMGTKVGNYITCLLYTSPSPRD